MPQHSINSIKNVITLILKEQKLLQDSQIGKEIYKSRINSLSMMSLLAEIESKLDLELDLSNFDFDENMSSIDNLASFVYTYSNNQKFNENI